MLGLSVRTLQVWRQKGTGPGYHKLGAAVRYSHDGLITFLNANREIPAERTEV